VNADFENGNSKGWYLSNPDAAKFEVNKNNPESGKYAAAVHIKRDGDVRLAQDITPLPEAATYDVTFWLRTTVTTNVDNCIVSALFSDADGNEDDQGNWVDVVGGGDWVQYDLSVHGIKNGKTLNIHFNGCDGDASTTIHVDNVGVSYTLDTASDEDQVAVESVESD